jgi:hypothetical protein
MVIIYRAGREDLKDFPGDLTCTRFARQIVRRKCRVLSGSFLDLNSLHFERRSLNFFILKFPCCEMT